MELMYRQPRTSAVFSPGPADVATAPSFAGRGYAGPMTVLQPERVTRLTILATAVEMSPGGTFVRNKFLRNLSADAFDYLIGHVHSGLSKGTPVARIA